MGLNLGFMSWSCGWSPLITKPNWMHETALNLWCNERRRRRMTTLRLTLIVTAWVFFATSAGMAQDNMKGMDMPMKQVEKMPSKSALQPAEGASVKIVSPKAGEVLKGDQVPLEFKLTKGKRGA